MLEAFRQELERTSLIPSGAEVLAGLSGGADSTCLVHLLHRLGIKVVAASLHHGQRAEADDEQEALAAWCASLDIPFVTGRADVPQMAADLRIGLEEAGRLARKQFLRSAASRTGCQVIATAHTRDDLVETMILNMARGTGLAGLAGIPLRHEGFVRPLLWADREQTHAYCHEHGLAWFSDPSNTDLSFSRARVRARIVPELEKLNPSVRTSMARLAAGAAEEDAFLNGMAAAALEKAEIKLNGALQFLTDDCEVCFSRPEVAVLPKVLLHRAIRLAARALGAALDSTQTKAVAEGLAAPGGGSVTSEGGQVVLAWDADRLAAAQSQPVLPFRFPLTIPGETVSEEFGWQFTAFACPPPLDPSRPRGSLTACADRAAIKGQPYFRTAREGDQIQPLGMEGRKLVSDVLQEMRLTRSARVRLPILCDLVGPFWIPGGPIADRVKVNSRTETALELAFGPSRSGQEP